MTSCRLALGAEIVRERRIGRRVIEVKGNCRVRAWVRLDDDLCDSVSEQVGVHHEADFFEQGQLDPDFSRGVFEALDLRVIGLI